MKHMEQKHSINLYACLRRFEGVIDLGIVHGAGRFAGAFLIYNMVYTELSSSGTLEAGWFKRPERFKRPA